MLLDDELCMTVLKKRSEPPLQNHQRPPIVVGRCWLVQPPQAAPPQDGCRIPLYIDPGKAFGAGDHPSTQLCLNVLARHLVPGTPVLDLGTGTGILAIAAAKLGASSILAVDIDDDAVRVARRNASMNGIDEQIQFAVGSLDDVLSGRFGLKKAPLVLANILSAVLIEFLDTGLASTLSDGGLLVLSGLLRSQTPGIRAALRHASLSEAAQETDGDWACILARKAK